MERLHLHKLLFSTSAFFHSAYCCSKNLYSSLGTLCDACERAEGGNDWGRHSLGNGVALSKLLGTEIKANKQIS